MRDDAPNRWPRKQIDQSLLRFGVNHIDLLQHHEVLRFDDPDRIFSEDSAMEAFIAAKQASKVRFIGSTGHKDPHIHLSMPDVARRHGFHFDTAQMPLNVMDAHFRSFAQLVVPQLVADGTGVLGMKALGGADGVILKSKTVSATECLHYALNLPASVVVTGIDSPEVLDRPSYRPEASSRWARSSWPTCSQKRSRSPSPAGTRSSKQLHTSLRPPSTLTGSATNPPHAKLVAPANAG